VYYTAVAVKGEIMSLALLIWFAIPIGIYTLHFEQKSQKKYNALFDNFYQKTMANPKLNQEEKYSLLTQLLERNGYEFIEESEHRIVGEKKVLSLGWIILGVGLLYIGVIFYLIYYYFIQKPHRVSYEI
jgi:uncharacterized membrane protein YukC